MNIKDLKALVKTITDTDITEFEMENDDERILIKRGPDTEYVQMAAPTIAAAAPAAVAAPAVAATSAAAPAAADSAPADDGCEIIPSPIVGTFYRKASPEADAFVNAGDVVEADQTVCLVEAMKMFKEIQAEFKCKIVEILKDDAAPVEFGEPLFKVKRI
ncbi:MAG: acetyl-CoA carboxylase biotin carboxyl carrier protein [Desulfuromonadales bacterium]|nr:acetyl-CoA carboxylase biotin carboxyl carrier protein [Desulfuromonadales bacterium]